MGGCNWLSSLTRNSVASLFGYSQEDLRVSKTVGSTQTSYLLDGESVVREVANGATTDLLQGPGLDNRLERGGSWILPCGLNSTSTVLDGSGTVLQRYYYAPFGQLTMQGGGTPQPYQFTGREADESGLMYYRARYYNPSWGRFVSEDPLGVGRLADLARASAVTDGAGFADSLKPGSAEDACAGGQTAGWRLGVQPAGPAWTINLFAYAADNPVRNTDPSGMMIVPEKLWRWALQQQWTGQHWVHAAGVMISIRQWWDRQRLLRRLQRALEAPGRWQEKEIWEPDKPAPEPGKPPAISGPSAAPSGPNLPPDVQVPTEPIGPIEPIDPIP